MVWFLLLDILAGVFVWLTGQSLPPLVGSHFVASGVANAFMPRELYVRFMTAIVVLMPAVIVLISTAALSVGQPRINLPNRDYWLQPERRERTIAYLKRFPLRFATTLVLFLCYAHYLVVRANHQSPPRLSSSWFLAGLAVFGLFSLCWIVGMLLRFSRRDE